MDSHAVTSDRASQSLNSFCIFMGSNQQVDDIIKLA